MINQRKLNGWICLSILAFHCTVMTFAYPHTDMIMPRRLDLSTQSQSDPSNQLSPVYRVEQDEARKHAVKSNHPKKVALDDLNDDVEGNQIQEHVGAGAGFSWSNMLSTFLQMIFNGGAGAGAPTKSDDVDNAVGGFGASPWANVISVGLKIINTLLGGGAPSDGIDKIDNGGSPMQGIIAAVLSTVLGTKDPEQVNSMAKQAGEFINIVMNLLDALKTSFSHRSLAARSIGKRDSVSDATVAGISMLKGYVRTYRSSEDKCMQKYMCEANTECIKEIGGKSIFCQLGSYATSLILERTSESQFENLYDAGRRGRSGMDCSQLFLECNEV